MPEKNIIAWIDYLLLNSIPLLKDEEYQRRVWFRHEGSEVDSYSETALHFIGGCETIFKYPSCLDFLGQENYQLLKKLYDLVIDHFDLIESRIDPDLLKEDELLNDPDWHDIQSIAEEVHLKLTEFVQRKKYESES